MQEDISVWTLRVKIYEKYGKPEEDVDEYNYFNSNKLTLKPIDDGDVTRNVNKNTIEEFLTEEGRLLARCRNLARMKRTREDEDFLVGEFKRVLSKCANLGSWQIALKCHSFMADLNLVRDRKDYQNVLICLLCAYQKYQNISKHIKNIESCFNYSLPETTPQKYPKR